MRFGNRAAYRQPHPQAAGFGLIEGIEDSRELRWGHPWARTAHRDKNAVRPPGRVLTNNSRDISPISIIASMALMVKFRIAC
jgi:hypothetical protein